MTNFIKKQTISSWLTLAAFVLTIVAFIIYGVNVASEGYFQAVSSTTIVVCSIFELIALAAVLVLSQIRFDGIIGRVVAIVTNAIKIVAAFLPMLALLAFISTRAEGLAYILASDEDLRYTLQTAENMSSCYTAITGFVFYGITTLVAIVAAFFTPEKAAKETAQAAA